MVSNKIIFDSNAIEFLQGLVTARSSILIGGASRTGKTTLLNILAKSIPEEDTANILSIPNVDDIVFFKRKDFQKLTGNRDWLHLYEILGPELVIVAEQKRKRRKCFNLGTVFSCW